MTLVEPAIRRQPLFVHGFAGNAGHWDEVRDRLDPNDRGVALDLAGHGACLDAPGPYTVERCAEDVIDNLPRSGALLVGHSMGARIALEVTARALDLVSGLVLVDGSNVPAVPAVVADELRAAIDLRGITVAMMEVMEGFLLDGLDSARRAEILRQAARLPADTAVGYWASMAAWDTNRFAECVSQVTCPVFVLQSTSLVEAAQSDRHRIKDVPCSRWLDAWQSAGKAQVVRTPNCGHYLMIERPDVVAKVLSNAFPTAYATVS